MEIEEQALSIGIGIVDHITIDEINILNATKQAMLSALQKLNPRPDIALIDAVNLEGLSFPVYPIKKGDSLSASIAAASIVAKVTRDRLMESFHKEYPSYQFNKHKGYPTPQHIKILEQYGPSPIHRKTFSPVRKLIEKGSQ